MAGLRTIRGGATVVGIVWSIAASAADQSTFTVVVQDYRAATLFRL